MTTSHKNPSKDTSNTQVKLEWTDPDFTKLPIENTQAFPLTGPGADFPPYS